jgi:hypothetical protein
MVPDKTAKRLRYLSSILLVGTSLLSLIWIFYPFFCPMGYAVFTWIPLLLVLGIFFVVSILTLKNLKRIRRPEIIRTAFIVVLVALGFQGLWFNETSLEWLGLLEIVIVIIMGIVIRKPLVKLEIMNWTGLVFLAGLTWCILVCF